MREKEKALLASLPLAARDLKPGQRTPVRNLIRRGVVTVVAGVLVRTEAV